MFKSWNYRITMELLLVVSFNPYSNPGWPKAFAHDLVQSSFECLQRGTLISWVICSCGWSPTMWFFFPIPVSITHHLTAVHHQGLSHPLILLPCWAASPARSPFAFSWKLNKPGLQLHSACRGLQPTAHLSGLCWPHFTVTSLYPS